MKLIDQLLQVLKDNPGLRLYERAVLKAAISMLDQEHKSFYVSGQRWAIRLTGEEADALPGEYWERMDGQVCPK